jgi:ABC-type Fe3+/spermidine/putrescine transport system ATPase subunit
MNFFEGRAVPGPGGVEVEGVGLLKAESGGSTKAVALAVRPERMRLHLAPVSSDSANVLSGTVEDIAYLGQDELVRVRVPGLGAPVVARVGSAADAARRLGLGTRVWCEWAPEDGRVLGR